MASYRFRPRSQRRARDGLEPSSLLNPDGYLNVALYIYKPFYPIDFKVSSPFFVTILFILFPDSLNSRSQRGKLPLDPFIASVEMVNSPNFCGSFCGETCKNQ